MADRKQRIVAYSGNRKVYPAMAASLWSMVDHTDIDIAYMIIEDDEFPLKLPKCARTINASSQTFFSKSGPNFACKWSYFTLIRAAYPLLFPQHNRILSLDCDTLIRADISELWKMDLNAFYFSASMEPTKSRPISPDIYTNVGVCLMNLKKLREDDAVNEIIKRLNEKRYGWPDQDAMNEVCRGAILDMPAEYNSTPWTKIIKDCKIQHYAGMGFDDYIRDDEFWRYIPQSKS